MFKITNREVKSLKAFKVTWNWYTFIFDVYLLVVYATSLSQDLVTYGPGYLSPTFSQSSTAERENQDLATLCADSL